LAHPNIWAGGCGKILNKCIISIKNASHCDLKMENYSAMRDFFKEQNQLLFKKDFQKG